MELFLPADEVIRMTGYKQAKRQIKRLNELGIPFIAPNGCTKYPLVRFDYAAKPKREEVKEKTSWRSNKLG